MLSFAGKLQVWKTRNVQDSGQKMKNVFPISKFIMAFVKTFFFTAYGHIG